MSNNIDNNKEIWEAVGVLTNDYYKPSELLDILEDAYRSYAYNHIALEEKGLVSSAEAMCSLNAIRVIIDGIKGKYIEERKRRKEAKR
jgi:hypothetical protein